MKGGQFSLAAMTAIDILGLEKTYSVGFWRKKPKCALKPLHLRVEEGEIFGFLGPNGAGKTTTLKMLMGLVFPTAGSAAFWAWTLTDPRMKAQIGFLPEQPYFYDYLTARELLNYYGQLSGVAAERSRAQSRARFSSGSGCRMCRRVQLRKFSKGMLQRVGIAQAILHDPKIVFFDEPMSGLDPMGRREVRDLMEELKHEGKTVFFSTHILSDAEALCDRVAIIHLGRTAGRRRSRRPHFERGRKSRADLAWKQVPAAMKALGADCHVTGDTIRAVLLEGNQDAALEALRREQLRVISLTPVRTSLEEYFVRKLQPSKAVAGVTQ